jgi:crotonobetainyl-CoA:carnitine CoA-transferase CaiB-like acyl-CoA transferase
MKEGMLSPYRVLDMTDEKGLMCGKMLGDLGADVIKIERPEGDPARNLGPFYHDEVEPEKSLFWFAYNTSKRGITLNIETTDGKEIFRRMVKTADFVIESFPPGYMDSLGLGYVALEEINPGVIMVSITPFGQTGPYKDYKAPDIVAWAMGGKMFPHGEMGRAPIRISQHAQAYLHAGAEGAVGALMALYHRERTGEGQQVDVSIQEFVARTADQQVSIPWDTSGIIIDRGEQYTSGIRITRLWECKNGYVIFNYWGGLMGKIANPPFVEFMDSKGMAPDFLKDYDWESLTFATASPEEIERIEKPTARFMKAQTKEELFEGQLKYHFALYPVNDISDVAGDVQLAARQFWVEVEHPELGASLTYPGSIANSSEAPARIWRRAPLIGEHNQEIYEGELGFSREQLVFLKQANVI